MTDDRDARQGAVTAFVAKMRDLATMPTIALEINRAVNNPALGSQALVEIISKDQALVSRVVRVANSAIFGCQGKVGSIDRAVFVLGFQAIQNIAIAASFSTMFRAGQLIQAVSPDDLWRHALATGVGASLLATQAGRTLASDAFLAGLMHDIGLTAELQVDRRLLQGTVERCLGGGHDFLDAELEAFGATHEDFGAALLRRWNFPAGLVLAVGHHHHPGGLPRELRRLPSVVHVADWMASQCALGFTLDVPASRPLEDEVLTTIGVTRRQVEALLPELSMSVMDLGNVLRVA